MYTEPVKQSVQIIIQSYRNESASQGQLSLTKSISHTAKTSLWLLQSQAVRQQVVQFKFTLDKITPSEISASTVIIITLPKCWSPQQKTKHIMGRSSLWVWRHRTTLFCEGWTVNQVFSRDKTFRFSCQQCACLGWNMLESWGILTPWLALCRVQLQISVCIGILLFISVYCQCTKH